MRFPKLYYTTESVLMGHPDKICDQISDLLLDIHLESDPYAHTAIECMGCSGKIILAGEYSSNLKIDLSERVREFYRLIGYTDSIEVIDLLTKQSPQLNNAVIQGGAGDQGIMYGYACFSPSSNHLPMGGFLANTIAKEIDRIRNQTKSFLPDGKIQLTMCHGEITYLSINVQHTETCDLLALSDLLYEKAVIPFIPATPKERVLINKDKGFINGGLANDTGLTGRKIIADTYGGIAPHGGGAFSGKDPTKVDRSAAYMARFVAKSIVANQLAEECIVAVSYAFGEEKPIMVDIEFDGEHNAALSKKILSYFDFRPLAIIEQLNLRKTKYLPTATYGHFTDISYPWEQVVDLPV